MTDVEKRPLIHKNSSDIQSNKDSGGRTTECRHYVLYPVLMCYYTAVALHYYVTSEWMQYYVKTELFRNVSMTTVEDACKAPNHSTPGYQRYQDVQETTASWNMYRTLISSSCSLIVVTVLPSYSDTMGRRFLFIFGYLGAVVSITLSAIAIYFKLNLWIVVIAYVIDNIFGSGFAVMSAACAFISDITGSRNRRTIGITTIDAVLLIMVTLTGFSCGFIIQIKGYFFTEALCVVIVILGFLLLLCFLPETHEKYRRSNVRNIVANFERTFSFYGSKEFRGKRAAYFLLVGAYAFAEMTNSQRTSIEMLYQLGMPFCWTNEMIGIFSSVRHFAQGFLGFLVLLPLKLCLSDVTIAILSALFNGASFVLEGLATTDLMIYLVSVPAVPGFLCIPMIKSVMSIITPSEKQGSLFASIMTVKAVCVLTNGFLLNFVYRSTVSIFNGFVFLMLAGICGLCFLLLLLFVLTQKVQPATVREDVNQGVETSDS